MKPVLSCEETRRLEDLIERAGTSKATLMELAGEFAASVVEKRSPKHVLVLVGFGNNGGDGWVAADVLKHKDIEVEVVSPIEPDEITSPLARHVARRSAGREVPIHVGPSRDELSRLIDASDVVLDAILGTGFHGTLRPPFSIWIPLLNDSAVPVVSIDVPSGLDSDTGYAAEACVRADTTATMLATKMGLYSAEGPEYAGEVVCGELYEGLSDVIDEVEHAAEILEAGDVLECIAPLPANIDKYTRGSVLVVAGSAAYPGAAMMAAKAAARAGAGYVSVATPDVCANLVRMALPSVPVIALPSDAQGAFGAAAKQMVCELAAKYDCVLCGPGMTTASGSSSVAMGLLDLNVPLILDADALNCLSRLCVDGIDKTPELYRRDAPLILTPHYRELARLVAKPELPDLGAAIGAAQTILWAAGSENMTIIAKGSTTAVVGVHRTLLPPAGPPALATAGSGDVLAGILAGILATSRGEVASYELLCSYAVSIHSNTGYAAVAAWGEQSVMATDLIDLIGTSFVMVEDEEMEAASAGTSTAPEKE